MGKMPKKPAKSRLRRRRGKLVESVDNVDISLKTHIKTGINGHKIIHIFWPPETVKKCGLVDNYLETRFCPIFTTSPAPIVINRSSVVQFSLTKFSISEKSLM